MPVRLTRAQSPCRACPQHWERDRYKNSEDPPAAMKLDLSDNCIGQPTDLIEELQGKRIRCSSKPEDDTTVHLPDFADQRPPREEKEPRAAFWKQIAQANLARSYRDDNRDGSFDRSRVLTLIVVLVLLT